MAKQEQESSLTVIARAPFELYFEGTATSVTATNKVGLFDILPGHADFFSVLSPGEVIIEHGGEPTKFEINNGIVTVRDNEVMMFVNM
jgi:F0F1-type ATP synthase epsilon subunit